MAHGDHFFSEKSTTDKFRVGLDESDKSVVAAPLEAGE